MGYFKIIIAFLFFFFYAKARENARKKKRYVRTGIRREKVDQRDEGRQLEERDGSTVDQPAAKKAAGTPKGDADELAVVLAAADGAGDRRGCDGLPGLRGQPFFLVGVELRAQLAQRQPVWHLCWYKLVCRSCRCSCSPSCSGHPPGVGDMSPAIVVLDSHSPSRDSLRLRLSLLPRHPFSCNCDYDYY